MLPLTLCGPRANMHARHFDPRYLGDQKELGQVFAHFWHLQPEIFHVKKKSRQNIEKQKSCDEIKIHFSRENHKQKYNFDRKNQPKIIKNVCFFKYL